MTNDLVALIDFYEREKEIERAKVIEAFEFAFTSAYRKMIPGADAIENLRAEVDTRRGHTTIFATLAVVADDDHLDKFNEIPLSVARRKKPDIEIGDEMEFNVTPKNFGRIAVQTAKQTMMQQLRHAEKEKIYEEFKDRAGDLVSGTVRRFEKSDVLIELGKFEGRMPQRERVPTEEYNVGDRLRFYVVEVSNESRGPEIVLSRSHPNFVRRLFEAEVNEIADRTVELRGVAREAGYRTKVAVATNDDKVDPVGACVGLRGARVKNIVREMNNEKVDIIRWSENKHDFVTEALKPARIRTINIDEEEKVINVTVDEEDLSKAIGRRGQNARLTSKLLDYDVQVRKDESQKEQFEARLSGAAAELSGKLGLDEEAADKLFRAGGVSPEIILTMPADYIAGELGIEEAEAQVILGKAAALAGADAPPAADVSSEAPAKEEEPGLAEEEPPAAEEDPPAKEKEPPAEEPSTDQPAKALAKEEE